MDKLSKKPADNHSTQYNAPSSTNHANVMQKPEHKKSHKKIGKVDIPPEAFMVMLKKD